MTVEDVYNALREVVDPELGINIVDLGLIYDVRVEDDGRVYVKMTFTTPGCPLAFKIFMSVRHAVKRLGVKDVKVVVTFDPPWSPERMSPEARKKLEELWAGRRKPWE